MISEERIARLEAQIAELNAWKAARELQALPFPLDDASKNSLGAMITQGTLSTGLTDTITIGAGGGSASVPKSYAGILLGNDGSATYKIPHLGTV